MNRAAARKILGVDIGLLITRTFAIMATVYSGQYQ